ncbi:hypothetical protein I3842_01G185100 [Carya illinoinensis]|uniref:Uncharacterized protein n=1 Tax=Carya illinoinensis TaxID=32201 RepID=A0A922G4X7_CARIL|nr:hypothetical protein I3842_01G185100 [Carya illinoinensis]
MVVSPRMIVLERSEAGYPDFDGTKLTVMFWGEARRGYGGNARPKGVLLCSCNRALMALRPWVTTEVDLPFFVSEVVDAEGWYGSYCPTVEKKERRGAAGGEATKP